MPKTQIDPSKILHCCDFDDTLYSRKPSLSLPIFDGNRGDWGTQAVVLLYSGVMRRVWSQIFGDQVFLPNIPLNPLHADRVVWQDRLGTEKLDQYQKMLADEYEIMDTHTRHQAYAQYVAEWYAPGSDGQKKVGLVHNASSLLGSYPAYRWICTAGDPLLQALKLEATGLNTLPHTIVSSPLDKVAALYDHISCLTSDISACYFYDDRTDILVAHGPEIARRLGCSFFVFRAEIDADNITRLPDTWEFTPDDL